MLKKLNRSSHTSLLSSISACLCAYTRQREISNRTYMARFRRSKLAQPKIRTKKIKLITINRKISFPGFSFFFGGCFAGATFRKMRLYCLAIWNHRSFICYEAMGVYEYPVASCLTRCNCIGPEFIPLSIISYFPRLQKRFAAIITNCVNSLGCLAIFASICKLFCGINCRRPQGLVQ